MYVKAIRERFHGMEADGTSWEQTDSCLFPVLARYQQEAYFDLRHMGGTWGGGLLCDGVGLGKTSVRLLLIEKALSERHKALVVAADSFKTRPEGLSPCPSRLKGWTVGISATPLPVAQYAEGGHALMEGDDQVPDYTQHIQEFAHPNYRGMKKQAGASGLNDLLQLLHAQGGRMDETVKQLLSDLPNLGKLEGFLFEVYVASDMIKAMPDWVFSSERQDGTATRPCDITAERDGVRIDIQCKRIRNYINEGFVDEFAGWVANTFPDHQPGLILEIAATVDCNETFFKALRTWMESNLGDFLPGAKLAFKDGKGHIEIEITSRDCDGIAVGGIWSASPEIGMPLAVEEDTVMKKLIGRLRHSRDTFGFTPGAKQFNVVAVQFPDMSLADDETILGALYGPVAYRIINGKAVGNRKYTGPFSKDKYPYCSSVLVRWHGGLDDQRMVIVPNRPYFEATIQLVRQFDCFRAPQDDDGRSLFPEWE